MSCGVEISHVMTIQPGHTALRLQTAIRKCLFLPGPTQNGLTGPRLLGSDIEKLLCIHYIHIISIICGLNLEMIEQVLSSLGFLTQCWRGGQEIIFQERKLFWSHRENQTNDQDETGGGEGGGAFCYLDKLR